VTPPPTTDRGTDLRVTYRFLRLGMVAMVVLLGVSVLYEAWKAPGCLQTSISAYYYTPVRSVFVGVLLTIGLCLIVIRGRTALQDVALNTAGLLAPVVALVPTADAGNCYSVPLDQPPRVGDTLAPWVVANVRNNVVALLVTGLVAAVVVLVWAARSDTRLGTLRDTRTRGGLLSVSFLITVGLVLVGYLLLHTWDEVDTKSHGLAAIAMFGCLGAAVFIRDRLQPKGTFKRLYRAYWVLMGAGGLGALATVVIDALAFDHTVFWLEVWEIAWFAAFWITRTVQESTEPAPPPPTGMRAGPPWP
jgi:hypothetical protein